MRTVEWPIICPFCGTRQELASEVGGADGQPEDGDVCFCFACGEVSLFDSKHAGGARKATQREARELCTEIIDRMTAAWRSVRRPV
jgi:hypothetical protein